MGLTHYADDDTLAELERQAHRIAELEAALCAVVDSYEDARDRMRSGTADKPSVSGQTVIDRARRLLVGNNVMPK